MVIVTRRPRSEKVRRRAREDGDGGATTTVHKCSTVYVRMSMRWPRFVSSLSEAAGRPLRGREVLDHAEKAFYHWVDGGIVVVLARADSDAPAEMESVRPKMLFNISFVGVRIHVVVLAAAASLVMVVVMVVVMVEHSDADRIRLMRSGRRGF